MQNKKSNSKGKGVPKGGKPLGAPFLLVGKCFFITYKGTCDSGAKLQKSALAEFLLHNPRDVRVFPHKYLICQQMYDSGEPHLHAILVYLVRKRVERPDYYDFMGVHPNIQTMRNMRAALEYVHKQDPHPLTNMDVVQQKRVARAKYSSSLYELLQQQMLRDPFNFDVMDYCVRHSLGRQIYKANYSKAISLLRGIQEATCKESLRDLPGLRQITPGLIESRLTESQLCEYRSWSGYSQIVSHINEIVRFPNRGSSSSLPPKTKHLYLVGDSDIGKSSLVNWRSTGQFPHPGLQAYFSTYYLNVSERYFPPYTTYMSSIVYWDQFVIDSSVFPKRRYNELLTYLSGSPTQIPIKGRLPVRRTDNPKHILSSNLTLQEQVRSAFRTEQSRLKALMNLRSRLHEVCVPEGKSIHFLRKLFVSA